MNVLDYLFDSDPTTGYFVIAAALCVIFLILLFIVPDRRKDED